MTTEPEFLYEGRDLEALGDMPRYYQWITAHFSPYLRGDVVEIGAGIGAVSKLLLPAVASLDLVEPSANLVGRLRDNLGADSRVKIFAASLADYVRCQSTESRDAVVMVNVLEHIEDDIDALRSIVSLLRPGGHLLLFVPAMPFLYSELDRLLGHYRRYTRERLKSVLSETEFNVVSIRYFDLLGMIPWWLVNTKGGATTVNPRLAKLYDTIGVPLTRAVESIVPPPVGKNLLLVAHCPT